VSSVTEAVRLYTVLEAAAVLNTGKDFVYGLIASGNLAVVELGTGRSKQRVRADTLQAYIEAHTFGK
jgi:excisionase family DNA binding protein